jgi:hypothetical protein
MGEMEYDSKTKIQKKRFEDRVDAAASIPALTYAPVEYADSDLAH